MGEGRHARVRAELALAMLRQRLDLTRSATNLDGFQLPGEAIAAGHQKSELVTARTRAANLQAELLEMRLARDQGEAIPRAAAVSAMEAVGRAVQRAHKAISGWAEEITGAAQTGGIPPLDQARPERRGVSASGACDLPNSGRSAANAASSASSYPAGGLELVQRRTVQSCETACGRPPIGAQQ